MNEDSITISDIFRQQIHDYQCLMRQLLISKPTSAILIKESPSGVQMALVDLQKEHINTKTMRKRGKQMLFICKLANTAAKYLNHFKNN